MSKTWKWILGIVIGLVVVAAVGFFAHGTFESRTVRVERFDNFRPPMADGFERDGKRGPGFAYDHFRSPMGGFNHGMPMYGRRGFGGYGYMPLPFMIFGGLLRLVFPLAVLGAVGYFSYKKGKKDGAMEVSTPEPEPAKVPEMESKEN